MDGPAGENQKPITSSKKPNKIVWTLGAIFLLFILAEGAYFIYLNFFRGAPTTSISDTERSLQIEEITDSFAPGEDYRPRTVGISALVPSVSKIEKYKQLATFFEERPGFFASSVISTTLVGEVVTVEEVADSETGEIGLRLRIENEEGGSVKITTTSKELSRTKVFLLGLNDQQTTASYKDIKPGDNISLSFSVNLLSTDGDWEAATIDIRRI